MTLKKRGTSTLAVEVTHIDSLGFWLLVEEKEHFLSFEEYPWFKDAKVKDITNVKLLHGFHLYWPQLDVDLEIDSLDNPQNYPLIYKTK
jgi:hypothetical protein